MGTILGTIFIFWLLMIVVGIAAAIFWIVMFVSAVKNHFEHKPLWIIVLLIGSVIGAIAFYFSVHRPLKAAKRMTQPTQS